MAERPSPILRGMLSIGPYKKSPALKPDGAPLVEAYKILGRKSFILLEKISHASSLGDNDVPVYALFFYESTEP